jgi:hypothetical protein
MTHKIAFAILLFPFLGLTSCSDKIDEKSIALDAERIAVLQCEARHLRNERFDTANNIRLREEDMLKKGVKMTPILLHQNDSIAKDLTQRTSNLAAKITHTLDSFWKNKYQTREQRQELDKAVEKIVAVKCH